MALEYVGGVSGSGGSSDYNIDLTSLSGGIDSSVQEGDLVIVAVGIARLGTANPGVVTSGYTEVANLFANDSRDTSFSVNWKVMGATPDTSVTVTGSGSISYPSVAVVHVWRGVDTTTPMDVTPTTATGTNSAIPDAPAITPVTTGAVVVTAGLASGTNEDHSVTAPTGYENQVNTSFRPATGSAIIGIASKAWSGAGAEDPAAWTDWETSTGESWCAVTMAIRPAIINVTNLAVGGDGTEGTSFSTASISPVANRLYLLTVVARNGASTDPVAPTVKDNRLPHGKHPDGTDLFNHWFRSRRSAAARVRVCGG
jgi:hypothetical protein